MRRLYELRRFANVVVTLKGEAEQKRSEFMKFIGIRNRFK